MDTFYVIDGDGREFNTIDEARDAAKYRASLNAKRPANNYALLGLTQEPLDVYIYQAIEVAREPTPDIEIEKLKKAA